jgi:hypothetical protein
MIEDRDLARLLEVIKSLALIGYPYPETPLPPAGINANLLIACGQIAGIVDKGLMEYRRDRFISLGDISDAEIVAATSGREC